MSYSLLLLLFYTQVLYIPLSALSFEYNRDYIARNLCINKSNPGSSCKGCCFLKKEIEQSVPANNSNQHEDISIKIFQFDLCDVIQMPEYLINSTLHFPLINSYLVSLSRSLIKPPGKLIV